MEENKQQPEDELQPFILSIKGMQRAQAPNSIFNRVMTDLNRPVVRMVPISRLSLVAACLVALIGLNIAVLANKPSTNVDNTQPIIEYYGTSAEYGYNY